MFRRLSGEERSPAVIPVGEAAFPRPFEYALEFNPPVHESWNIVHVGMQVPESHQIYICADNCMRGVVLTAAEMGMLDRFSSVVLTEKDFLSGKLEEITLEGVSDVIRKLPKRPRAVLVFPVCVHHFVGTDMAYVYRVLEERFPDIDFMRCWMDPIMQKGGITPEQKERKAVLDKIPAGAAASPFAIDAGSNVPLRKDSDLSKFLQAAGKDIRRVADCSTYDEFLGLGRASLVITRMPAHVYAARPLADRLGVPMLYLPPEVTYEKIERQRTELGQFFGLTEPDDLEAAQEAFAAARAIIKDTPIELDNVALVRPLGFARQLIEHGFNVCRIWLDAISPEEEDDFHVLQKEMPQIELGCPTDVRMRTLHGRLNESKVPAAGSGMLTGRSEVPAGGSKVLAIGPKAAWMADTEYFVNILEQDGGRGYEGLCHLLELMVEAFKNPKDTRQIVPRKGLGCSCVIET